VSSPFAFAGRLLDVKCRDVEANIPR